MKTMFSEGCKNFFADNIDGLEWVHKVGIIHATIKGEDQIIMIRPIVDANQSHGFEVQFKGMPPELFYFNDFFESTRGSDFTMAANGSWIQDAPSQLDAQAYIEVIIDYINLIAGN